MAQEGAAGGHGRGSRYIRLARRAGLAAGYCAAWAALLSSAAIEVPFDPLPPLAFFLCVQFLLGRLARRGWALALCAFPPLFAALFPGALPPDPDIPDYAAMVAAFLAFPIMPLGALITWLGVRAGSRPRAR